jgi:hypothetical protein
MACIYSNPKYCLCVLMPSPKTIARNRRITHNLVTSSLTQNEQKLIHMFEEKNKNSKIPCLCSEIKSQLKWEN